MDARNDHEWGSLGGGAWLVGGGEMGKVVRTTDWGATPLGALDSWPQSLRTTVGLCLASNFPISVVWGPKHVQIYNDGYWRICGAKHPGSMGQDFSECWSSAWPVIGDAFARALGGETSFLENQRMFLDRDGYLEETFFTFSFSPIRDETGAVGGLFHPVTETTTTMLAERRTRALRDLADQASNAPTVEEALGSAARSLASCELDLPFVLFYVVDAHGKEARLVASNGLAPGGRAAPPIVNLAAAGAPWRMDSVERSGEVQPVLDLEACCGPIPCDPYPESPRMALALPIKLPGWARPTAIVVAGVSPRLPLNDAYRAFYDLLTAGVTTAVADAHACQEERKHAEALAELDRAKTTFFSNVGHAFRTPLTPMLGPLIGAGMLEERESVGRVADISDLKRTEEALRQTEEQLRQAQKMEAVGRLAGGVAHDFNNILSVVLSYSEMALSETSPGDPVHVDLMEIRKAGQRAAELTRQLLMFSRQQVLEPKVLDLNQLLSGMERMLRRLVGEDVELLSIPGSGLGRVRVDAGSLEQVIMNLVVNARDAMPVGGSIVIETENAMLVEGACAPDHVGAKAGPHVVLSIRDAGTGMDRATRARMFEPFFTTKGLGKGTGLGLSTVFGIVQQSEGSLRVQSEPGKGTTVKVYLPIAESPLHEIRAQAAPSTLRGSETILLVEDEEPVRSVARDILMGRGYRVLEAENGRCALKVCRSYAGAIDLLLSDVVMPKMSGPELARRFAKARPAGKVLYMSGYTEDAMVRHGALDARVEFIQKPFTPELMARRVREVLEETDRGLSLNS